MGHNYITGPNETVDPANGSLSVRIAVPTPPGRGINVPFAFEYDSAGVITVEGGVGLNVAYGTDHNFAAQGGWRYGVPVLNASNETIYNGNPNQQQQYSCQETIGYNFTDFDGSRHALGLGVVNTAQCQAAQIRTWGPIYHACDTFDCITTPPVPASILPSNSYLGTSYTLSDTDGNTYYFPSLWNALGNDTNCNAWCVLPQYIEDRNGNILTFTGPSSGSSSFPLTINDSVGRNSVTISSFGSSGGDTVAVSGQKQPYMVTWGTTPYNINPPLTYVAPVFGDCWAPASTGPYTGTRNVITSIQLPNGDQYSFGYDPISGLLNKLTYPTGAYITYTWGLTSQPSDAAFFDGSHHDASGNTVIEPGVCFGEYSTYVVTQRRVYDGVNKAQTQNFTYATSWSAGTDSGGFGVAGWTGKQTTVTTQDLLAAGEPSFDTVYTYSPFPLPAPVELRIITNGNPNSPPNFVPLENTITYKAPGGTVLRTVAKTWDYSTPNRVLSETTTAENSLTSAVSYQYSAGMDISEQDDTAFGVNTSGSVQRKLVTSYIQFPQNASGFGSGEKPCMVQIEDGNGTVYAETDTLYDSGTTVCGSPGTPIVTAVSGLPPGTHDETNFGVSSTVARGNATSVTRVNPGGVSNTTTFTYDETGQVLSITDGCGNATCADVTGSKHTTTYSYTDSPVGGNTAGSSNAYVTSVTNPLNQVQTYQYNYATGEMSTSTDANSQSTTYSYSDPMLRVTDIYGPPVGGVSAHTQYSYVDGSAPSVTVTNPIGVVQESLFDGLGHVTQTQLQSDPLGTTYVSKVYDGLGRIASTSNPYRTKKDATYGTTQYAYDSLNRKILQTQPDGSTLQWCYNGVASSSAQTQCAKNSSSITNGVWVNSIDEAGNHSQRVSDGLGRLVAAIEPDPAANTLSLETDYSYNVLNNLLSVGQNGSAGATARSRSFTYDALSQLLTANNPETGTICYGQWSKGVCSGGYDANGNLAYKTDGLGTTTYLYDVVNRLVQKGYPLLPAASIPRYSYSCYQYDTTSVAGASATGNFVGRLSNSWTQISTSSPTSSVCPSSPPSAPLSLRSVLAYDPVGRVQTEQQCTVTNCSKGTPFMPSYIYDLAGNVVSYTDGLSNVPVVGSIVFGQQYDGAGRLQVLSSSWNPAMGGSGGSPLFTADPTSGYTPAGQIQNLILGDNIFVNKTYDSRMRITGETATHP